MRQLATHQSHDADDPILTQVKAVEETFDDHEWQGRIGLQCPVQVEQLLGFAETCWQLVLRRVLGRIAWPTADVRHELAIRIVNGYDDAAFHAAVVAAAEAEFGNGRFAQPAFRQIRMRGIEVAQFETEGLIWPSFLSFTGRLGWRLRRLVFAGNGLFLLDGSSLLLRLF